jgi:hypothetical protein
MLNREQEMAEHERQMNELAARNQAQRLQREREEAAGVRAIEERLRRAIEGQ